MASANGTWPIWRDALPKQVIGSVVVHETVGIASVAIGVKSRRVVDWLETGVDGTVCSSVAEKEEKEDEEPHVLDVLCQSSLLL